MNATIQALYDRDLYKSENQKSSRFNKLKPEVVLFSQRPSFEYIKEMAVSHLGTIVNDQLELLTLVDKFDYSNMDTLSKNIFSCSKKEFLKRRALENCVWIDVMKKHAKGDCLEKFKIKVDLREIKNFLKLLFKGLQRSDDQFDLVCKTLSEADTHLNMIELLHEEKNKLKEELQDYEFRYNARLFTKRQTKQQLILWAIEETMLNAQTWDPIEMRFEMNWYQCKTEQAKLQNASKETGVQQLIEQYKLIMLTEQMSGDNIRDIYYTLAEQHKHDINVLQNRFDFDRDEIDNKINYTRLQISKLIEQQNILSEQIEEFHEQIIKRLEKAESERQEQELERLRLEEEVILNKHNNEKDRKIKSETKAKI